jgi:hypothetical protein
MAAKIIEILKFWLLKGYEIGIPHFPVTRLNTGSDT